MFLPFPAPQAPLRLTDASVGRREYAVELRIESKTEVSTETALVAERFERKYMGFERNRYVVGSTSDETNPEFKPGERESDLIQVNGVVPQRGSNLIPLPDITFPDDPLTVGAEWISKAILGESIRCRYVGEETVAGRLAARIKLVSLQGNTPTTIENGYVLIDRADSLPLQTYVRVKLDVFGITGVRFRLRRTNVAGLNFPN